MATVVRMPEVLANSGEASIQTWLVKAGQTVVLGEALAEVETEKATVEYVAETAGVVLELLVTEGESVAVGAPILIVGVEGEKVDAGGQDLAQPAVPAPEPETAVETGPAPLATAPAPLDAVGVPQTTAATLPQTAAAPGERTFASPLVRRLARERGLDLAALTGTGPSGRIVRRDLEGIEPQPDVAECIDIPYMEIPHTGMRRAIARRLTDSTTTIPHFYLRADCRVDKLVALRAAVNSSSATKVSLNDFVIKAAAAAFVQVPAANAIWGEKAIRQFTTVDIAVAVSVPGGLLTPVIRSVETLSITEIAANVAELADRARTGRIAQAEIEGGSFSISSLGMFGVTEFSAIINPPHSGILAVGAARPVPVVDAGLITVENVMTVTLSADHRVMDGVLAAQWLAAFVAAIEQPSALVAGS